MEKYPLVLYPPLQVSSTLTLINLVLYPPLQSPCVLCDSRAIYSLHSNRLWALPCNLIDFCCPPCCCLRSALSQLSTPSLHSFHSLPNRFLPILITQKHASYTLHFCHINKCLLLCTPVRSSHLLEC